MSPQWPRRPLAGIPPWVALPPRSMLFRCRAELWGRRRSYLADLDLDIGRGFFSELWADAWRVYADSTPGCLSESLLQWNHASKHGQFGSQDNLWNILWVRRRQCTFSPEEMSRVKDRTAGFKKSMNPPSPFSSVFLFRAVIYLHITGTSLASLRRAVWILDSLDFWI